MEIRMTFRKKKYVTHGLTEQPFPIIVGSFDNITACYVAVNDICYKVENPLKAIDITFKIITTLDDARYPPEAANVWDFISAGIYDISTKNQNISVVELLADIRRTSSSDDF